MSGPVILDVDPEDRPAWLAQRREGIGSSDAPALMGMDRFQTPYSLWVDKTEGLEVEETAAMRWGRRLESAIADEFGDEHGEFVVVKPKVMYRHAEIPFMQSNPDRLLFEPRKFRNGETFAGGETPEEATWDSLAVPSKILECKCSNIAEDWDGDYPPDRVLVQVQHQLCVNDVDGAYVALLEQGRFYRDWFVARDDAAIEVLCEEEAEFWKLVQRGTPPAVDGHAATSEAIKQLYQTVEPESRVELGEDGAELFVARALAKDRAKDAEATLSVIDNMLREKFGHASTVTINGEVAATYNSVTARRIDQKALLEDHPELAEQYRKPSSYRRLDVKKGFK